MSKKLYYITPSGAPNTFYMQQYDIDGSSHNFVGDEPSSSGVSGFDGSRWVGVGANRYYNRNNVGVYKGKLTAFMTNGNSGLDPNTHLLLCQLNPQLGTNGQWEIKASGAADDAFQCNWHRYDDKIYAFVSRNYDNTDASRNKHWIMSWDGISSNLTIEQNEIFFGKYFGSDIGMNRIHNFQAIKAGDNFICGVTNGKGKVDENNILRYSPKTNTLASGFAHYSNDLQDNTVDESYVGMYDPSRVPGTSQILFVTDSDNDTTGWRNVISYDFISGATSGIETYTAYAPTVNQHNYGFTENQITLLSLENPSGDLNNNYQGVYAYFPQAGPTAQKGRFRKFTTEGLERGQTSNNSAILEQQTIYDDFNYSSDADRAKSRHNFVSFGSGVYLVQSNADISSPGQKVPRVYEFDTSAGSSAEYGDGGPTAEFPSGVWSFLDTLPNLSSSQISRECFISDLENDIDVIISSSNIVASGTTAIINYTLYNQSSGTINILPMYSSDQGAIWNESTDATGGDGRSSISSLPSGDSHSYHWDVLSDLSGGQTSNLMFRIVAL